MAGRIPDHTIREVLARTDLAAVVGEMVDLQRSGAELRGLCPFHNEKTPSFYVNKAKGVYRCYGCGASGDTVTFVRETRGLSFIEAVEALADRAGVIIERETLSPQQLAAQHKARSERGRLLDLHRAAQDFFRATFEQGEAGQAARSYAAERGLNAETIERFGVGAAGSAWGALSEALRKRGFSDDELVRGGVAIRRKRGPGVYDRFRDRLMFPIRTAGGDIVGFGGRALLEDKDVAKYMNSPETPLYTKSEVVFGLYEARKGIRMRARGRSEKGCAVVVEGNLDVMMLHQAGETAAVSPMGTSLTETQVRHIARFADRVALVFDGDRAGREAAMKAVPACIAGGLDGVFAVLPAGEDPDSFVRRHGVTAWQALLEGAPALIYGFIDGHVSAWDGTAAGESAIYRAVKPILLRIPDPVVRELALNHLAARLKGGHLGAARRDVQRLLARVDAGQAPDSDVDPKVRAARALEAEARQIAPLERHLAAVVLAYPRLLVEVNGAGGLELLRHEPLARALRGLARQATAFAAADTSVDGPDAPTVLGWIAALPDVPEAVVALLRRLACEDAPVAAEHASEDVERSLDKLEIAALEAHRAELQAERQRAHDAAYRRALFAELVEVQRRIQTLKTSAASAVSTSGASPASASPPAPPSTGTPATGELSHA